MKEICYKDGRGNIINISVVGFFKISELEKEFIMYSFVDDKFENDEGIILLGEVIRSDDDIKVIGIDSKEKEMVVAYYNEISEQIGGKDNE